MEIYDEDSDIPVFRFGDVQTKDRRVLPLCEDKVNVDIIYTFLSIYFLFIYFFYLFILFIHGLT